MLHMHQHVEERAGSVCVALAGDKQVTVTYTGSFENPSYAEGKGSHLQILYRYTAIFRLINQHFHSNFKPYLSLNIPPPQTKTRPVMRAGFVFSCAD